MAVTQSKRPTLKTISDLTGFAVPTVSRALKDAPDIGKATRAKVQKIAREIGYVPDRAGLRLRTGKTNVISLVLSTEHDMMNHTARLISSVAGALRDTPYHMIITPFFPDEDPLKPVRHIVETGSADAVILNQIEPEDRRVAYLMEKRFPFATHGRSVWSKQHPYFDFDNGLYGRFALRSFAKRDRKQLLMVAPPVQQSYARMMIEGARHEASTLGLQLDVLDEATSDDPADVIQAAVRHRIEAGPKTDGILAASTTAAMASVAALEATGRRVAEDVDVICKEAVPFLQLFRPGIITVKEDVTRAGAFLAQATIQAINAPEAPPMQSLDFPSEQGGTTRDVENSRQGLHRR